MRRVFMILTLAAVALVVATVAPATRAQDATPTVAVADPSGLTFDILGYAPAAVVPSPADLVVARITIEPGAALPSDAADPSLGVVVVESGEITAGFDGAFTVTRATALEATGSGDPPTQETVAAGEEATLGAGDVGYFPPNIGGAVRNDGDEPAVVLAFLVSPAGGEPEATPTP